MDIKIAILCVATILLWATTLIWGIKFLRRSNYLLGIEYLVVTVSTTNLFIYLMNESQLAYDISFFLDAFSRAAGIPIIATAGLMAVTHNYKPSKTVDILFFVGAFAGTAALLSIDAFAKPLPYFYLVMWSAFSIYLVYFGYRLIQVGEYRHAVHVVIAMLCGQAIATIYDFFKIPGDEQQIIFLILALTTWSYLVVVLYYAFYALKRATISSGGADVNEAFVEKAG
ncbi:hypothetical protein EHN06_10150 [Marinobacter sp. NP-4(2019)]|uniref:hypothetical protein n=1 Tax=Marinobacter sp. NP-4(2019) TaxID=2488665 RepID=UPI000FC3E2CE|nr:hypothetical protein [Marinobacter sp. NP-4(2019)]AZT83873.1 hypothetical protein EHN06_10150 [Marinobacter sp. NP-4(2019)]